MSDVYTFAAGVMAGSVVTLVTGYCVLRLLVGWMDEPEFRERREKGATP